MTDEGPYISRWLGFDDEVVALARTHGDEDDYARTLDPLDGLALAGRDRCGSGFGAALAAAHRRAARSGCGRP